MSEPIEDTVMVDLPAGSVLVVAVANDTKVRLRTMDKAWVFDQPHADEVMKVVRSVSLARWLGSDDS